MPSVKTVLKYAVAFVLSVVALTAFVMPLSLGPDIFNSALPGYLAMISIAVMVAVCWIVSFYSIVVTAKLVKTKEK